MNRYTYNESFNELWGLLLRPKDDPPAFRIDIECDQGSFLVLDTRVSPVRSELWLTPVHWAVCARIKWDSADVAIHFKEWPLKNIQIPFVDLIFSLPRSSRPWLLLPTDQHNEKESVAADPVAWSRAPLQPNQLRHLLRAEITSEDNRTDLHAIHNLIVPLILNGMLLHSADQRPDHTFAIGVMLQVLDLMAAVTPSESREASTHISVDHKSVILVDDQAKHGWEQWVRSLLRPDVSFQSIDPHSFWNDVKASLNEPQGGASACYVGSAILLDLRLGGKLEAEVAAHFVEHASKWLHRAQVLGVEIANALRDDLNSLRSCSQRHEVGKFLVDNLVRLTLLSRLVAVAFPRVPVVLFSSTQDPAILKRLEIFGNLITSFTKGTVAKASMSGFSREHKRTFQHAIRQSARVSRIARLARGCEKAREYAVAHRGQERAPAAHVELYIDESGDTRQGDPEMKLGGVVALFLGKNCHEATQRAHQFNRLCLEQHFCPFTWGPALKMHNMGSAFPQALSDALRDPDAPKLSVIELSTKGPSSSFLSLVRGDRQHRDMLTALINLFAAAVLPEIEAAFGTEQLSVSIYAGSRVYPAWNLPNGSALPYQMGFGYTGTPERPELLYVLGDEDVGLIAFEAFQRFRTRLIRDVLLQQVLAVGLAYDADVDRRHDPRPVRNSVNHVLRQRTREIPGENWQSQYRESRQDRYPDLQPDCRALHYVADLCLTDATLVPMESWSFRNDFDILPVNRLLESAQRLRCGQDLPRVPELAEALLLLEKADVQHRQGAPRLLAADLCRLAGGSWEQVLAAAFRHVVEFV